MSIINGENELPEGLGFKLALDMDAMKNFSNLPDNKKQELISYIRSSTTGDQAKNRVSEVVDSLHRGESTSFF